MSLKDKETETSIGGEKKTISPYFLTSHDSPGNIITQVQLKGENYEEWARAVRTSLKAKKKYGFISGAITQRTDDSTDYEDWWTVNSMIVSWIFNTIEATLRSTISHKEVAKDLWDDIQQRFSVGNGPRVHQLKSDLANCKQKGETVLNYFGRLKKLWDEIDEFDCLPSCTCRNCTCNLGALLEKRRKEERLHQFLMGLDKRNKL